MKKLLLALLISTAAPVICSSSVLAVTKPAASKSPAAAKFTGTDYSGDYSCVGNNAKIGSYNLVVTFVINKAHSHGKLGRYDLSIETENAITYGGQAIANGTDMALTIEIVDGNAIIFSTGIARLKVLKNKRFSYINQYYESKQITNTVAATNTGNDGFETCIMQVSQGKSSI